MLQIAAVSISGEGSGINFRRYGWNKILSKYKEFSISPKVLGLI